jgi:hypothetical protein
MRTVKWNPFLSGGLTVVGAMVLWCGAAQADVSSTNAAAIVVFPKIVVDTTAIGRTDTIIQLTNTSADPVNVRCFLVNANGHCSNSEKICDPVGDPVDSPCGEFEICVAGWQETDFSFRLTPKQPIVWCASKGLPDLPLSDVPNNGQFSSGSILAVPEDPFVGELKCIQVGDDEQPVERNDLKGEATIQKVTATDVPEVDSRGYNAIGIQAIEGANDGDDTLILGEEYNACPNIIILDHFFDDARNFVLESSGTTVRTHLTCVPCSEDFNLQAPITTVVQFLVFNEFEQRFSTSRSVTCFSEIVLSDIDTRPGPTGDAQSIFNVNVQGTITGQTLVRAVADADETHGHGLLCIAEEFHCAGDMKGGSGSYTHNDTVNAQCGKRRPTVVNWSRSRSNSFSTVERGTRTQRDFVYLPAAQPPF